MAKIVCDPFSGFDPKTCTIVVLGQDNTPVKKLDFKVADIKIKKTAEEKKAHRRIYRRNYAKRPKVMEKQKERLSNPENIKKRKEYSERPDVKARKKELSERSRTIKRMLQNERPDLYKEFIERFAQEKLNKSQGEGENNQNEEKIEEEETSAPPTKRRRVSVKRKKVLECVNNCIPVPL